MQILVCTKTEKGSILPQTFASLLQSHAVIPFFRRASLHLPRGRLRQAVLPLRRAVAPPSRPHRRKEVRLLHLRPQIRPLRSPREARGQTRTAAAQGATARQGQSQRGRRHRRQVRLRRSKNWDHLRSRCLKWPNTNKSVFKLCPNFVHYIFSPFSLSSAATNTLSA